MTPGAIRRIGRSLLSLVAPMVGTRSSGTVLVHATGGNVTMPGNTYAVPVIVSAGLVAGVDLGRLFKTTVDTTVTAAGVSVPVVSVLGGANLNLPAGTKLIWDPSVAGVEASSLVLAPGLTGGTEVAGVGQVRRVVRFEGTTREIWQAQGAGPFPAMVISWEGAGEARRVGRGSQIRVHRFRFRVITTRFDSHAERQDDGEAAIDNLTELLVDRAAVDRYIYSTPPTELGASGREAFAPTSLCYFLDANISHADTKRELRPPAADWTKTNEKLQTAPDDPTLNPSTLTVVDQSHDQDPDT